MPEVSDHPAIDAEAEARIIRDFLRLTFRRFTETGDTYRSHWLGVPAIKYPTDLMMYQELIVRRRPDLIVETGTHRGGSALFLATICELIGHGAVISIDIGNTPDKQLPQHPRLRFVGGSSTDPDIVAMVHARAAELGQSRDDGAVAEVMVILDSDHRLLHVFEELETYAPLIRPGGYIIAEDTHVNGRPNWPEYGPGPGEAVALFLTRHREFQVDHACTRFAMTLNAGGYLRRRALEPNTAVDA
ncbi:CmcI family methyltransferase [Tistrella sp. BH-R2-4]|uniref:CmcI family methyltransferase n=1 Tax=Tistrella arctica TaxID=3133430 RepID=A0ABU9YRY9_9PROT